MLPQSKHNRRNRLQKEMSGLKPWQRVYQKLQLHRVKNITSYQVNNDLFIVIPLADS